MESIENFFASKEKLMEIEIILSLINQDIKIINKNTKRFMRLIFFAAISCLMTATLTLTLILNIPR